MEKIEITIVGAGAVGLALAYELSRDCKDILVLEKNISFGQETSSRNSEVIHAGLYYPRGSLKAKTCIEGKQLLYDFCKKHNISHKKIGKLIVAINNSEIKDLECLFKNAQDNGVEDLKILDSGQIKEMEPNVAAQAAIFSPSTGILDSHSFMKSLVSEFKANSGSIVYNTQLLGIDKVSGGFKVYVRDNRDGDFEFFTRVLVNSAGLDSDKIARIAGIDEPEYKLKYCKGDYFRVADNKAGFIKRLVYPVPKKDRAGLGIHATLDLSGGLRLGPDDEYVELIDYNIDSSKGEMFYESAKCFLPFIEAGDLRPDTAGVRPKLQGPGEPFRDFLIRDERERGLEGFINLVGIESPGLTASLSIAKLVKQKISQIISDKEGEIGCLEKKSKS